MHFDIAKWSKYPGHAAAPSPGRRPLPYGLTIETAYSMIFPIGEYNTHQFTTPGHNDYFIIPNVSATYITRPNPLGDGVELDGHFFYDHATENPETHYSSADVIDLDHAVTERSGRLQYGFAGFAATQIGRDTRFGETVPVRGNDFTAVILGPIIGYRFPKLGLDVKAKRLIPAYIRNAIVGPQAVIAVGFKL